MKRNSIEDGAKLLKAIGNPKRLEILYNISDKEMSVGEVERQVGLSQSALSQHLALLRKADIVKTRREAQTIYYSIKSHKVLKLLNFLESIYSNNYGNLY